LSKIERLIQKALTSPQNLRFAELQKLCSYFGMKLRNTDGSHFVYKRMEEPKFTISIQNDNGKAKEYQVRQLMSKVKELNLYDFGEGD